MLEVVVCCPGCWWCVREKRTQQNRPNPQQARKAQQTHTQRETERARTTEKEGKEGEGDRQTQGPLIRTRAASSKQQTTRPTRTLSDTHKRREDVDRTVKRTSDRVRKTKNEQNQKGWVAVNRNTRPRSASLRRHQWEQRAQTNP